MNSFPESATFVLFQRLHILLRGPAVFFKEFFVFFDDRVKLLSNPLKILEVKGYKMEAALGQLLSIEYLGGESKIVMNKLISCTIQKSCTGEGQGRAGQGVCQTPLRSTCQILIWGQFNKTFTSVIYKCS